MTIRRNVNLANMSDTYRRFEEGCDNAPDGLLNRAKAIAEFIAEQGTDLIKDARSNGIAICNCDGIREIDSLLFNSLWVNAYSDDLKEINIAIYFGEMLAELTFNDQNTMIAYVKQNADSLKSMEDWKIVVLTAGATILEGPKTVQSEIPMYTTEQQQGGDWAVMQGVSFCRGGFLSQESAQAWALERLREWTEAMA